MCVVFVLTAMVSMSVRSAGGPHFSAMSVQFPRAKAGGTFGLVMVWILLSEVEIVVDAEAEAGTLATRPIDGVYEYPSMEGGADVT